MTLSEYLKLKDITHADFAASLEDDSSEISVRKWASGERTPRPKQMRKIFTVTNGMVTPNDFCGVGLTLVAEAPQS